MSKKGLSRRFPFVNSDVVPPQKAGYRQTHRYIREGLTRPYLDIAHQLYWRPILRRSRRSFGGAPASPVFSNP